MGEVCPDGGKGDTVSPAAGGQYDFHEVGGHLENVDLELHVARR